MASIYLEQYEVKGTRMYSTIAPESQILVHLL